MKFGTVQTKYAAGGILAHSLVCGRDRFRKGKVLDEKDIRQLIQFGYDEVVIARLEDNDTEENLAAAKVAEISIFWRSQRILKKVLLLLVVLTFLPGRPEL